MNIRAARLNKGLSTRKAAEGIGVTQDLLIRAEAGSMPHPKNAKLIADFYEVQVTDIWPVPEREAAA